MSNPPVRVGVLMDPTSTIQSEADSTFALALEAQSRGHKLWHFLPAAISFQDGVLTAQANAMTLQRVAEDPAPLGETQQLNLATDLDVILMRQDPPFDMQYITISHLLEGISDQTLVVNNPREVRNAPEKLFATEFAQFMPATLITRDEVAIRAFRQQHPHTIVKPLFGNGGIGVFYLKPDDENLSSLLENLLQSSREQLMIQAYIPEIRQGDKRIILVDGEPIGAINRIPADGEARANLHVGGRAMKVELTAREREICATLGPVLRARGLLFVGIDVIGNYLTEINVTSPTGLQELKRFDGVDGSSLIWDAIERKLGQ